MKRFAGVAQVSDTIEEAKNRFAAQGVPFHADALAAALNVSYDTLVAAARGEGVTPKMAATLTAALQECTASVVSCAMAADAKHHALYMWYLRNRGGFSDKGSVPLPADGGVTFIGEGRI